MITLFLGYIVCDSVVQKEKTETYNIFNEVVRLDIDERMKSHNMIVKTVRDSMPHPDSTIIQTEQKTVLQKRTAKSEGLSNYDIKQYFLSNHDPVNVFVLDSMFCDALRRKGMLARTAVICSVTDTICPTKSKIECSTTDHLFLLMAFDLPIVKMEIPAFGFKMELRGFVLYSWGYLLKNTPHTWIFLFAYILFTLVLVRFMIKGLKDTKSETEPDQKAELILKAELEAEPEPTANNTVEPTPILKNEPEQSSLPIQFPISPIPPRAIIVTPPPPLTLLKVADNVFLNEKNGDLIYNTKCVLQLKGLPLRFFIALVKAEGQLLEYDKIKKKIWQNENTDNKTISHTVIQLSKDLQKQIPFLSIQNIRNKGYRLAIENAL